MGNAAKPSFRQKIIFSSLFFILLLSFFLRFYRFSSRWILNQDQARDTVMIMYALKEHSLPLLGSPASAGPFSFGPYYHWLIGFFKTIIPTVTGPWIGFAVVSSLIPLFFWFLAKNVADKYLAFFLGLTAALATAQVINAPDMLNTVLTSYLVSFCFCGLAFYLKKQSFSRLFLFSFLAGLATVPHFQSLGVLSLPALVFLFELFKKNRFGDKIKKSLTIITALLLSYSPLLLFDIFHQGAWLKSVFLYFSSGQNKFYYPVRWLTDLTVFWPSLWGQVISGYPRLGYLLCLVFGLIFLSIFLKPRQNFKKNKFIFFLVASFLMQVVFIRYYKGVRSSEYFFTFHPYFIFFTAWSLWQLFKKQKILAVVLSFSLFLFIFKNDLSSIKTDQSQASLIQEIRQEVEAKTGQTSFSFYTYRGDNMLNLPLFYLFYENGQIQDQAYKIGTCRADETVSCPPADSIISQRGHYLVYDLNQVSLESFTPLTAQKINSWLYINY